MSAIDTFLSPAQENDIVAAIREAERNTSGEIRVHIEKETQDAYARGLEVFHELGMDRTAARNGVLLYIAVHSRNFAILGDKGIDELVPDNFWDAEKRLLLDHFKKQDFATGICAVVKEVGERLKAYFPYQSDDRNELTDEVSKGS
jgi:uncharacterized membrane protein